MKRLLLILLLTPAFLCPAYAQEPGAMELFEAEKMESGLSREEAEISGELRYGAYDVGGAMKRLWGAFREKLTAELHAGLGLRRVS